MSCADWSHFRAQSNWGSWCGLTLTTAHHCYQLSVVLQACKNTDVRFPTQTDIVEDRQTRLPPNERQNKNNNIPWPCFFFVRKEKSANLSGGTAWRWQRLLSSIAGQYPRRRADPNLWDSSHFPSQRRSFIHASLFPASTDPTYFGQRRAVFVWFNLIFPSPPSSMFTWHIPIIRITNMLNRIFSRRRGREKTVSLDLLLRFSNGRIRVVLPSFRQFQFFTDLLFVCFFLSVWLQKEEGIFHTIIWSQHNFFSREKLEM